MRRLLALLFAAFALSVGACSIPSEESPSDQKNSGKSSAPLTLPQ
jgi:hypothetical protein